MKYDLDFLPEVEKDVLDTYDWYEEQSLGLGEDFLLSIDAALNGIMRDPLLNPLVHKNVRKVKTKRFPYGDFYTIEENTITVVAITHLSRKPFSWKKRLKKEQDKIIKQGVMAGEATPSQTSPSLLTYSLSLSVPHTIREHTHLHPFSDSPNT